MARRVCALCGRDLDGAPEAIAAGSAWFCSTSHLLDYETRQRRAKQRGTLKAGAIAAAAVVAVVYALASENHTTGQATALPYTTIAPASANGLNAQAFAVARRWANASYVAFDCKLVRRLSAAQAEFEQSYGTCEQNQADMLRNRSRDRRVTLQLKRQCAPTDSLFSGLGAPPYKEAYDCIVVRAQDIECGLSSEKIGQKVINFWAPGSSTDEIFLARLGGTWRIVAEQPVGASGGGGNLGRC
ncbi:MAG TPA: hypothetical protein VMU73_08235, partial [Gaiellaceae bacterium]|nr:hypothetical protein [Gaiellaceae bacterium]